MTPSNDKWHLAIEWVTDPHERETFRAALQAMEQQIRLRPFPVMACFYCGEEFDACDKTACSRWGGSDAAQSEEHVQLVTSVLRGFISEAVTEIGHYDNTDVKKIWKANEAATKCWLEERFKVRDSAQLIRWLAAGHCPPSSLRELDRRMTTIGAWSLCGRGANKSRLRPENVASLVRHWVPALAHHFQISELVCDASGVSKDDRPGFPLRPLLSAWEELPTPAEPETRPMGILALHISRRVKPIPCDAVDALPPQVPGFASTEMGSAYLPNLFPDGKPLPAILHVYDRASEHKNTGNVPPVAMRLFLELLVSVPAEARDGQLHELRFTIRDMVEMMGWRPDHYRRKGQSTGAALRRALETIRDIRVEISQAGGDVGWYFPLSVSAVEGLSLDSRVSIVVRLPKGSNVGPPIARGVLRELGKLNGPAYRGYLALCCDWNEVATHGGRLIRPSQPEVRRATGGQVVDARGNIVTGKDGKPVTSPHHPKAVATGERAPNEARKRYRSYNANDLVSLCYPANVLVDQYNVRKYRARAMNATRLIERVGGCTIEPLGGSYQHGLPWRIMAPDIKK